MPTSMFQDLTSWNTASPISAENPARACQRSNLPCLDNGTRTFRMLPMPEPHGEDSCRQSFRKDAICSRNGDGPVAKRPGHDTKSWSAQNHSRRTSDPCSTRMASSMTPLRSSRPTILTIADTTLVRIKINTATFKL